MKKYRMWLKYPSSEGLMESHLTSFLTLCCLIWLSQIEEKRTFVSPVLFGLKMPVKLVSFCYIQLLLQLDLFFLSSLPDYSLYYVTLSGWLGWRHCWERTFNLNWLYGKVFELKALHKISVEISLCYFCYVTVLFKNHE